LCIRNVFTFSLYDGGLNELTFSHYSAVEQIFREANVSPGGHVQYQDFVKIACAPVPDYY